MKLYSKYENGIEHVWYESSNIVYSQCYDKGAGKSLKLVFKGGRTYLYTGVSIDDYILFRDAQSTGESASKNIIKKYKAVRLEDVDLAKLAKMLEEFNESDNEINKTIGNLIYHIEANKETGEIRLKLGDKVLYEGIEGNISLIDLFASMRLKYTVSELTTPLYNESDFLKSGLLEANNRTEE